MTLHRKFVETAKRFSQRIAVADQATRKEIDYNKMLISALILARKFKKYQEKNIGLMVPTSAGAMLSILGVLLAKKIPVMINYSTGAIKNCEYATEKCSLNTIITSKKLLEKLNIEPLPTMIFLEDIVTEITLIDKIRGAIASKLPVNMLVSGSANDLAFVLFTSGSEKTPKGVKLSHKNILSNLAAFSQIFDINEKDTFMSSLPLFHVFGLTVTFWYPLIMGAKMIAQPNPLEYTTINKLIKKYQANVLVSTPSFLYGNLRKSKPGDFDSVKLCIAGADKVTPHLYDGFLKKHNVRILEGYGTTETSPVISVNTNEDFRLGSIGKLIPGVKVKIIDTETDKELPAGETGKIMVKGENVMQGYYDDPEETSYRIHNHWYDTGDMGCLDKDGYLWHKGRLKRFVKIGGEMVSLVEVESYLERILPEDALCCVVDVPNPKKGADIVAAITTTEINRKKIKKALSKDLPSIAIPREVHYIEDIPMMPSGKVNFREVEKICRKLHEEKKK